MALFAPASTSTSVSALARPCATVRFSRAFSHRAAAAAAAVTTVAGPASLGLPARTPRAALRSHLALLLMGPTASAMQNRMSSSSSTVYQVASTDKAPKAIGPYSQATIHNGLVFCSGCIPFDPVKMECVEGGIEAQTQRALDNLFAVLEASGSDKSHVLKTTVFLKDMNDFAKVNGVYEAAFAPYKPARSAVEVARLPRDVLVEVEAIAAVKA
ncbi:hypothetical protein OC844_007864 [Tilletia horrida]|nr:hypothetical protein OC844_007864 [Tilletia horrida]